MNHSPVTAAKENYYIGSLPGIVDGRELRRYLQQFGEVESLEVIKDAATGKCKGYAFLSIDLTFSEKLFLSMRHYYDGRIIFIRQKLRGADLKQHKEDFQQKRLYISTNSRRLSDKDLFDYFSFFGEVDLAYFVKNHNKSKDKIFFGYVNFKTDESVHQVMLTPKHLINKQEVKCDIFRPKKKESDCYAQEKLTNSDFQKKREHFYGKGQGQSAAMTKKQHPVTLNVYEKKALLVHNHERTQLKFHVNREFHSELKRMSRELDVNHTCENLQFTTYEQLLELSKERPSFRTRGE